MPNTSQIDLRVLFNTDDVGKGAKKANAEFDSMGKSAEKNSNKISDSFKTATRAASGLENAVRRLYNGMAAIAALHLARDIVKGFFDIVTTFERSRIAFKAFIGDAHLAEQTLQDIKEFAKVSPLNLDQLMEGGSLLLALGTEAKKVLPYLQATSAAVGAIGGDDPHSKMTNIIQDIEKISARGHVTGEVLRNLGRNGINATKYLAEGFHMTNEKIQELVTKGAIPAAQAIEILFQGMENQFGKFAVASQQSIGTAISNISDNIKSTIDTISQRYQPELKAMVMGINNFIGALGKFLVEHKELIQVVVDIVKVLAVAWAGIKFLQYADKTIAFLRLVPTLLTGWAAPLTIILTTITLIYAKVVAVNAELMKSAELEARGVSATKDEAAAIALMLRTIENYNNKVTEKPRVPIEIPNLKDFVDKDDPLKEYMAALRGATKLALDTPDKNSRFHIMTEDELEAAAAAEKLAEEAKKATKAANNLADSYLDKAKRGAEETKVGRIIEEYKQLDVLAADQAHKEKSREGFLLNMRTEFHNIQKKNAEDAAKEETATFSAHIDTQTKKFQAALEQRKEALDMMREATRLNYETANDPTRARDEGLLAVRNMPDITPEDRIAIENAKLEIERTYLDKRAEMERDFNRHRMDAELETFGLMQEMETAIRAKYTAIDQKLWQENQDAQMKATMENVAEVNDIRAKANKEAADKAIAEQQRIFTSFKSEAGKIIDALVSKDRWKGLGSALKATVLTAMKDILSSQIAIMFMRLMGFNAGTRAPAGASPLGNLLGALGFGGIRVLGNNSITGGPGGTGGFAGAVANTQTTGATGGIGSTATNALGVAGLAKSTGLLSHLGSAAGLGALGVGGGLAGMLGAWKLGQSNSKLGKSLAVPAGVAGGLLAGSGLMAMFPALLTFGMAVPFVGAAIGAVIGIMALVRDNAVDKLQKEVERMYGFKVERSFAEKVLMPIIKTKYGGDIRMGLASPEVREMLKLYAMSRGINTSGIVASATPSVMGSINGTFQQMPTFQNGAALYPTAVSGTASNGSMSIQLDGPATTQLLQGEAVEAIAQNQRVVSRAADEGAGDRATRASAVPLLGSNYVLA